MQKSIRRGDVATAVKAAQALYQLRGRAIWRRLILIACEDVGAADFTVLTDVLETARGNWVGTNTWQARTRLERTVAELAEAAKDRSTDYLISAASVLPALERMRERCGSASLTCRVELAVSEEYPLEERAVAAWYASGLNIGSEKRLDRGDLDLLLKAFEARNVPPELCASAAAAARATREPFVVLLPLVWSVMKSAPQEVRKVDVDLGPRVGGAPLYALDKHTRLGKAAISAWLKSDQITREALLDAVPEYKLDQAACMGAFYVDAIPVAKTLVWDQAGELYRLGLDADMFKVGVPADSVPAVIEAVRRGLPALNEARRELLNSALLAQTHH